MSKLIAKFHKNRGGDRRSVDRLVLASGSPYRRSLLEKLGLPVVAVSSNVDESRRLGESPLHLAARLAESKCTALQADYPNHLIIGSDQVAMLSQLQLTKPGNRKNAVQQLRAVSGKSVIFYTGVCLLDTSNGQRQTQVDVCTVHFRNLRDEQIERYVDRDEPFDCAGSFKSESLGITLFQRIEGEDPNALIGLPLIKLVTMLEKFGVKIL
ncbi:MAG: nucleoside triphosphate pyrophosphatase [Pseudomonadota bacterium]